MSKQTYKQYRGNLKSFKSQLGHARQLENDIHTSKDSFSDQS